MRCRILAGSIVVASLAPAYAQEPAGPLAPKRDEKPVSDQIAAITQDPAIPVDDPATRALAQALLTEGLDRLKQRELDQALANFLEAYTKFPHPQILLNVAGTLHDMNRLADAANTYQRYMLDPQTGSEQVGEVKAILNGLDEQLTILTVRVFPKGSDVSIDGGPFIPVGTSLLTRVRPGIHLVRVRKGDESSEVTVNGFEGETKEVPVALEVTTKPDINPNLLTAPEHVDGWLITGTQYSADSGTGRERKVRSGYSGPVIEAMVPEYELAPDGTAIIHDPDENAITSGAIGVLRIDGEGRGFAGGLGIAISRGKLEAELMVLRSDSTGGYLGVRYRFLTGFLRPYIAVGVPGFAYDQVDTDPMGGMETTRKLAIGLRGAAGIELTINGHLSVQGDLGYEHFFVDEETTLIDANIFVPTLGVIGRL